MPITEDQLPPETLVLVRGPFGEITAANDPDFVLFATNSFTPEWESLLYYQNGEVTVKLADETRKYRVIEMLEQGSVYRTERLRD